MLTPDSIKNKAALLLKTFEKHPPAILKETAFKLMQKASPGTDEFKAYAALYEYCGVFI